MSLTDEKAKHSTYTGMLFSIKKKGKYFTGYNMGETGGHSIVAVVSYSGFNSL